MTLSKFELEDKLEYLAGFNQYHETEAVKGAIPKFQHGPQKVPFDLYTERISGTTFTAPRKDNKQSWLYRQLPSTSQAEFKAFPDHPLEATSQDASTLVYNPTPSVWACPKINAENDFLTGLEQIGGAGDPKMKDGVGYYLFTAGKSMPEHQAFYSADGDFLLAPQVGTLDIRTELGCMRVRPREICVIPRGFRFHVSVPGEPVRGYGLEVYSGHFELPELGPIGSTMLANVRDFEVPKASFVDSDVDTELICKYCGKMFRSTYPGSIFNVVGWGGTYYPYKYDLGKFSTIGGTNYDHPDPSIFTVLRCPTMIPGESVVDLIVFGPRWLVMENTYRPPSFHRNVMSEFFFVLEGSFDLEPLPKELEGMFALMNIMSPHGQDPAAWKHAVTAVLKPERIPDHHMAIMFESRYAIGTTNLVEEKHAKIPWLSSADSEGFQKARVPTSKGL